MTNTSATGGFLQGSSGRGREEIENILHDLICGITGMGEKLVRPRWQPEPPTQPQKSETWCAFGVVSEDTDNFPAQIHGRAPGKVTLIVHGKINVLTSFYGPAAQEMGRKLRNGLHIAQNRYFLKRHGMNFLYSGTIQHVPGLTQYHWLDREDLTIVLSVEDRSDYAILDLVSAHGILNADDKVLGPIDTEEM